MYQVASLVQLQSNFLDWFWFVWSIYVIIIFSGTWTVNQNQININCIHLDCILQVSKASRHLLFESCPSARAVKTDIESFVNTNSLGYSLKEQKCKTGTRAPAAAGIPTVMAMALVVFPSSVLPNSSNVALWFSVCWLSGNSISISWCKSTISWLFVR